MLVLGQKKRLSFAVNEVKNVSPPNSTLCIPLRYICEDHKAGDYIDTPYGCEFPAMHPGWGGETPLILDCSSTVAAESPVDHTVKCTIYCTLSFILLCMNSLGASLTLKKGVGLDLQAHCLKIGGEDASARSWRSAATTAYCSYAYIQVNNSSLPGCILPSSITNNPSLHSLHSLHFTHPRPSLVLHCRHHRDL